MKVREKYTDAPSENREDALALTKEERQKKTISIINKVLAFLLTTFILIGVAGLGVEYVLVEGPSPALRDTFVMTMLETRRFGFMANIFLSDEEVAEIKSRNTIRETVEMDTSLINIPGHGQDGTGGEESGPVETIDYGLVDEDGDGIIIDQVVKKLCTGYMMIVQDPSRVFVGKPNSFGGTGLTVEDMCQKYDAIGGINAGGFKDDQGSGTGGIPQGLTIVDGHCYNDEFGVTEGFAGFDSKGVLHVGYYTYEDCVKNDIVNAVSFGPVLISNGTPTPAEYLVSGINPRTAIGQRADGAVLMLVIDGRQVHSAGATYQDCVDIMLDYGAVNACNMDGGSSTAMYYQGKYVNSISSSNGQCRPLPNAFMFK